MFIKFSFGPLETMIVTDFGSVF